MSSKNIWLSNLVAFLLLLSEVINSAFSPLWISHIVNRKHLFCCVGGTILLFFSHVHLAPHRRKALLISGIHRGLRKDLRKLLWLVRKRTLLHPQDYWTVSSSFSLELWEVIVISPMLNNQRKTNSSFTCLFYSFGHSIIKIARCTTGAKDSYLLKVRKNM